MSTQKEGGRLLKYYFARLNNPYLVVKDSIALLFFTGALFVMSPISEDSDLAKILLATFGSLIILFALVIIAKFILLTSRLQLEKKVRRYSSIVSLNSIFGLVIPLYVINSVLFRVVGNFLYNIRDYDTIFCEFRKWLWRFLYHEIDIDNLLTQIAFWIIIIAIALFMFGGLFERGSKK
jgi:hypothetical protein